MHLSFVSIIAVATLAAGCQTSPPKQAARPVPDAALRETRWVLRQLGTTTISVPANTNEPFLTLRTNGTAEGNGSCNRFRGKFSSEIPGELKFSPLMSTRMACPAMAVETDFNIALAQTTNFRIIGDTLRLLDATDATLARLEAVYLR